MKASICTYSGVEFWPLAPRVEDIRIEDIAHALALQCRFTGHVRHHYSVAQHSVIASLRVSPRLAMVALLHDAAEAYIVDIPKPIKRELYVARDGKFMPMDVVEDRVASAIFERFRLPSLPLPSEVKLVDRRMLATEKRDLLPEASWWTGTGGLENEPYPELIERWTPEEAEQRFLARFQELEAARGWP